MYSLYTGDHTNEPYSSRLSNSHNGTLGVQWQLIVQALLVYGVHRMPQPQTISGSLERPTHRALFISVCHDHVSLLIYCVTNMLD